MQKRFLAAVREHRLISPGERVGVAVSGGADSVALLRLLAESREELAISLAVLHVNHGLRGAEAVADAEFVAELAARLSLPFHLRRAGVRGLAEEEHLSLEAAGRAARYRFFSEQMHGGLECVATAHTLDDQAETVLLRLLRGTGTQGLAAIHRQRPADGGRIVRPLLDFSRVEIEGYLRSLGQSWREDKSNREEIFLRNRVRHELLPMLVSSYNPALRRTLAQTAELAAGEESFWQTQVEAFFSLCGGCETIPQPLFAAQPVAMQRRILRKMLQNHDVAADFAVLEQTRRQVLAGHAGQMAIVGGWQLRLERHPPNSLNFYIVSPCPVANVSGLLYDYAIDLPCERCIAELGAVLRLSVESGNGGLSLRLRNRKLHLRNWMPGDRFHAQGRGGEKKLKELFPLYGVETGQRKRWPLLATEEGEIVWVWKLPPANRWAAGADESASLAVQLLPGLSAGGNLGGLGAATDGVL
jgi:tRNA(Ile)-lysidine synthase